MTDRMSDQDGASVQFAGGKDAPERILSKGVQMLVISRKRDEKFYAIVPGDLTKDGRPIKIEVMVVKIMADRTSLGIKAPMDVKLLRDEHQADVDEMMGVPA